MTPAEARAMYRQEMAEHGETITLRRGAGGAGLEASALARIVGFTPEELASGIFQGNRKAIVLAEDLEVAGFPEPIKMNDGVHARGRRMNVEGVDDATRRIGGVLIAYELDVKG